MYTSVEAVISVLVKSPEDAALGNTAAALTTGQIEDAIASAGHEVDAKLANQYQVPFADYDSGDCPPLVSEITRDIAAYLADLTYRQDVDYTSMETDPVMLRYRRTQELLQLLIDGTIALTGATPNTPPAGPSTKPAVVNGYEGNLFDLCDFDLGTNPRHGRWEYWPSSEW